MSKKFIEECFKEAEKTKCIVESIVLDLKAKAKKK